MPVCAASQCDFVCASGWRDCDGLATTGCEAAILTDSANCGSCGNACAGGGACFDGHCPFGLDFDGLDDTLASKTALAHGLSSTFTAEFWIRADGTTWMKLLNIHNGPNLDVDMEIRPDGLAYCTLFDQSGNNHGSTSTSQVVLGAWTHIACSYDGTTQRMFVNGVLEASTAWTGQVELDAPVTISGFESRYIDRVVDEFRLGTSARYTASFTPPAHFAADANALVLWLLDEGTGITVTDGSGHGFDGQLGGGAAAHHVEPRGALTLARHQPVGRDYRTFGYESLHIFACVDKLSMWLKLAPDSSPRLLRRQERGDTVRASRLLAAGAHPRMPCQAQGLHRRQERTVHAGQGAAARATPAGGDGGARCAPPWAGEALASAPRCSRFKIGVALALLYRPVRLLWEAGAPSGGQWSAIVVARRG